MAGQLDLFETAPIVLSDVDAADLWVEKMREHKRVQDVVECFPEGQRDAVALATIRVGGYVAWREVAASLVAVQMMRGRFFELMRDDEVAT